MSLLACWFLELACHYTVMQLLRFSKWSLSSLCMVESFLKCFKWLLACCCTVMCILGSLKSMFACHCTVKQLLRYSEHALASLFMDK